jgi:hypothetical protein
MSPTAPAGAPKSPSDLTETNYTDCGQVNNRV